MAMVDALQRVTKMTRAVCGAHIRPLDAWLALVHCGCGVLNGWCFFCSVPLVEFFNSSVVPALHPAAVFLWSGTASSLWGQLR